ncbi:Probable RNA-directed DNA polymerase from transposon BS [Eumeta japonica]|uniref:Probable RNA-directed DNA polymerase from transposon BS n=1 Tax=Eumeta variegata TaxID=151549 RepID=A0A4C1YPY0_EUMVA|nr:Probable RNA-directed DNA polymerase from transposon BS [Eumeta japonica]
MRRRRLGSKQLSIPEAVLARNIFPKTHLPVLPSAEVPSQIRIQEQIQYSLSSIILSGSRRQCTAASPVVTYSRVSLKYLFLYLQPQEKSLPSPNCQGHGTAMTRSAASGSGPRRLRRRLIPGAGARPDGNISSYLIINTKSLQCTYELHIKFCPGGGAIRGREPRRSGRDVTLCGSHALVRTVVSFLKSRSFFVTVENATSDPRPIRAGVPQGSCLSPCLYAAFTVEIPTLVGLLQDCGEAPEGPRRITRLAGQITNRRQCDEDGCLTDRLTAYHATDAETSKRNGKPGCDIWAYRSIVPCAWPLR